MVESASPQSTAVNVVVCGLVGSGKSSLVNMLVGEDCAETDGSVSPYTSTATAYDALGLLQDGSTTKIWDTPGLDDDLQNMLIVQSQIYSINGVSVILFCHGTMSGRINQPLIEAFKIMTLVFGMRGVPVALVITGLERIQDREEWWNNNVSHFEAVGMKFDYHACITSTKGDMLQNGRCRYEDAYNHSAGVVQDMVRRCLTDPKLDRTLNTTDAYAQSTPGWFIRVITKAIGMLFGSGQSSGRGQILYDSLRSCGSLSEQEAVDAAKVLDPDFAPSSLASSRNRKPVK